MKLVILERNSVGTDVDVSCFEKFGEVTCYPNTVAANTSERVKDADIILANKAPLNESTLKDAPTVKLICLLATGFDNVDLAYCKSRSIKVTNVVNYCTSTVAQHTLLLALALSEKIAFYDDYVKSGAYSAQDRFSNFDRTFYDLEGKTWGIIGMGTIGRRVAGLAAAGSSSIPLPVRAPAPIINGWSSTPFYRSRTSCPCTARSATGQED